MPQYSEVTYNVTEAYVAALTVTNTYGTPVPIDYIGKFSFTVESDTDELMSAGQIVETLAIPKKNTGELSQGSLDFNAMAVLCGYTQGNYSTTPNQYAVLDMLMGGSGLPFFGLLVAYASTLGGNVLVGFPKAKLQTVPGFEADQNKFTVRTAGFDAIAPTTTRRASARIRRQETAATLAAGYGASAGAFLGYFTTPPPSMFS
jgi:hypothetical protein